MFAQILSKLKALPLVQTYVSPYLRKIRLVIQLSVLVALAVLYFRAENLAAELKKEKAARVVAEQGAEAIRRESIFKIDMLEQARKEDDDRNQFTSKGKMQLEAARATGDGSVAPALREQLERVRVRELLRRQGAGDPG